MKMTECINFVIEGYVDEDGRINNIECIEEIRHYFKVNQVRYLENYNYCDCGPGYEQWFYVFSWIEDGRIFTYEVLIEHC